MQIKKSIQCTPKPLQEYIDNGEGIDFRLDEPQWADLKIGDVIEYWEDFTGWQSEPAPNSRKILVELVDIFRARSFVDLINHPHAKQFFEGQHQDDIIQGLRQWWTKDKENLYGVLGLRIKIKSASILPNF